MNEQACCCIVAKSFECFFSHPKSSRPSISHIETLPPRCYSNNLGAVFVMSPKVVFIIIEVSEANVIHNELSRYNGRWWRGSRKTI